MSTIIISAILICLVGVVIRKMYREKKTGKGCCGGCSGCPGSGACGSNTLSVDKGQHGR